MHCTVVAVTTDSKETKDGMGFDEQDLFDVGAKFDYVENFEDEGCYAERVSNFLERMERAGAMVDREAQSFTLTEDVVRRYFAGRYDALREMVNRLTLDEFAGAYNPDSASKGVDVWSLQNTIEDEFDDGIFENGAYRTLDSFMRHATSDMRRDKAPITYYVRGAVSVHY